MSEWLPVARQVVATNTFAEVDGVILDQFSASVMTQVHDALSPPNAEKFSAMPLAQAHDIAFKLVAKTGGK